MALPPPPPPPEIKADTQIKQPHATNCCKHPTKWLAGQAFSGPTCQDISSAGGVAGRVDAIRSIVHSTADSRSESYSGDCDHAADHRKDQGIFRRRRAGFRSDEKTL